MVTGWAAMPPYGAGCSAGSEEDSDAPGGSDVAAGAAVVDGEAAGSCRVDCGNEHDRCKVL